jgi:hypothetical protein
MQAEMPTAFIARERQSVLVGTPAEALAGSPRLSGAIPPLALARIA